jgi:hypothetical protein
MFHCVWRENQCTAAKKNFAKFSNITVTYEGRIQYGGQPQNKATSNLA